MDALNDLNPEQRRAATAGDGAVVIIAGPGTGKTKTLVARIAYLLASGAARADEILALTYTNKAAREMQSRVAALVTEAKQPRITTFHSLCFDLLQRGQSHKLELITEADRLALIRELRTAAALKQLTTRELAAAISLAKGAPLGSEASNPAVQTLLKAYEAELRDRSLYDFDDLLQQVHHRLQTNQAARDELRRQYRFVLVDEFQDTGQLQYQLLQLLAGHGNLFVIGDPLQSIYGFRGASAAIFDQFRRDFSKHQEITLATNYRSAPAVVALANAIFPKDSALQAHRQTDGSVQAVEVLNEYGEASYIIREIEQHFGGTDFLRSHQLSENPTSTTGSGGNFRNFAILYRTHRAAATLERAFAECGIPYQVVGDGSPYEQPNIQTILHILHYLAKPHTAALAQLVRLRALRNFSAMQLETIIKQFGAKEQSPSDLAVAIAETFGLFATASDEQTMRQFINMLVRFDDYTITETLEHLDLSAEQGFYDPQADAVTLLTIHASKGLEFEHVFLLGTEDGLLPHQSPRGGTDLSSTQLAEERRLLYVAATRARSDLTMLHARFRGGQPAHISPFIEKLTASVLPRAVDPGLADQQRRLSKHRQKRAQTSLF